MSQSDSFHMKGCGMKKKKRKRTGEEGGERVYMGAETPYCSKTRRSERAK